MTGFLVVMGLVAVVLGIIYRKQTVPALKWFWASVQTVIGGIAFVATLLLFVLLVCAFVVSLVVAVVLLALTVFMLVAGAVVYVPVVLVSLVVWTVTRKRTAFDKVTKPFGIVLDTLFNALDTAFDSVDVLFDKVDVVFDKLDTIADYVAPHAKVAAVPFVWLSRKLWPRG